MIARSLLALALLASTSISAAPAADAITGVWHGTSKCTAVRPACRDEIAVDHIAATAEADVVAMTMNKVVDGQEVPMGGTLPFHVDYSTRTLTYDLVARDGTHVLFQFTWKGEAMSGVVLELPSRKVIRNIELKKGDWR
jgi:hypothetical protein